MVAFFAAVSSLSTLGWAAGSASPTNPPLDLAVFPASVEPTDGDASAVQLAGSGPRAWAVWTDDQGSWAQRADLAATAPPISLGDGFGYPLEAYTVSSGVTIAVLYGYDDDSDFVQTLRLTPQGARSIDRVVIPGQVLSELSAAASPAGAIAAYRVDPADEPLDFRVVAITADQQGNLSRVTRITPKDDDLNTPGQPVVALDARGRAVVCWHEPGPEAADGTSPSPTVCRIREPGARTFAAAATLWNSRDLGIVAHDPQLRGYVRVEPQSVTIADDGSIGVLGSGDGEVAAVHRDGRWGAPTVLSAGPTEFDRSSGSILIDPAGVAHAAWVNDRGTNGGSLHTAAVMTDGSLSSREIDRLAPKTDTSPQLVPTADGGVALLWVPGRRRGGPLRLALAPPDGTEFTAVADRESRSGRTSLDFDISSPPDQSSLAVVQHLTSTNGEKTGTAAISVMPVLPPSAGPSDPTVARALIVRVEKPIRRRGTLSLRVTCRSAGGNCLGHVTLTAKGPKAVSRRFAMTGTSSTLATRVRFSGAKTRALLRTAKFAVSVSARTSDGRIAAARRTLRGKPVAKKTKQSRSGRSATTSSEAETRR